MSGIHSRDVAATIAAGEELGRAASAGGVIALVGELGSGKTHFTKGIAAGLGFEGEVTSPTFALVQEYRGGRLPLFHFDFYRIENAFELESLGWDDYLEAGGVCVVEWADKFSGLLPKHTRWVHFTLATDGSRVVASE